MNDEGSHILPKICNKLVYHFDTYMSVSLYVRYSNRQLMDALSIATSEELSAFASEQRLSHILVKLIRSFLREKNLLSQAFACAGFHRVQRLLRLIPLLIDDLTQA